MPSLRRYEPGDVVLVRDEPSNSTVVMPTHRECRVEDNIPPNVPNLGPEVCVPLVLVRTPAGMEGGKLRWVENRDLVPVLARAYHESSPVPP